MQSLSLWHEHLWERKVATVISSVISIIQDEQFHKLEIYMEKFHTDYGQCTFIECILMSGIITGAPWQFLVQCYQILIFWLLLLPFMNINLWTAGLLSEEVLEFFHLITPPSLQLQPLERPSCCHSFRLGQETSWWCKRCCLLQHTLLISCLLLTAGSQDGTLTLSSPIYFTDLHRHRLISMYCLIVSHTDQWCSMIWWCTSGCKSTATCLTASRIRDCCRWATSKSVRWLGRVTSVESLWWLHSSTTTSLCHSLALSSSTPFWECGIAGITAAIIPHSNYVNINAVRE